MSRKLLPMLVSLFILLSGGLFWAKWERDHPTPTAFDLKVRQRFVHDEYAEIHLGEGEYRLSSQERREIASHLFLIPAGTSGEEDDVTTNGYQERIIIAPERLNDLYRVDVSDIKNDNIIQAMRRLHPSTSRFLREWLAKHPQIVKRLRLNSIE